ncbi:MAG: hypothetical protein ACXU8U_10420, partial [Asticcacaulis sp.]
SAQYAGVGGSGDLSLALKKETAPDTAQVLWQAGFSTRAILGLLGDDNLTLKVSPDGSAFVTALSIDRTTGLPTFVAQTVDPSTPADGVIWYNATNGRLRARQDGQTFEILTQVRAGMIPASGRYVLNHANAASPTAVLTGVADRMEIAPWVPAFDHAVDQLGVNVTTGVAGAKAKLVIYDADAMGRPGSLLIETADIGCAAAGPATAAVSLTFRRGRQYWLGVRHSSTASLSAHADDSVPAIDGGGSISLTVNTLLRRSLSYATAAPANWAYSAGEAVSDTPLAVFIRLARSKAGYFKGE